MAEEVTARVEKVTASAQSLVVMTQELQSLVAQFTLPAAMAPASFAPVEAASVGGDGSALHLCRCIFACNLSVNELQRNCNQHIF